MLQLGGFGISRYMIATLTPNHNTLVTLVRVFPIGWSRRQDYGILLVRLLGIIDKVKGYSLFQRSH